MISSVDHGARVVAICSSLPSRRKEELILHWVDRAVRSHIADKLEELGHGEDANKLRARSRLAAMSELKNFVAEVDVRLARAASGTELALTTGLLRCSRLSWRSSQAQVRRRPPRRFARRRILDRSSLVTQTLGWSRVGARFGWHLTRTRCRAPASENSCVIGSRLRKDSCRRACQSLAQRSQREARRRVPRARRASASRTSAANPASSRESG